MCQKNCATCANVQACLDNGDATAKSGTIQPMWGDCDGTGPENRNFVPSNGEEDRSAADPRIKPEAVVDDSFEGEDGPVEGSILHLLSSSREAVICDSDGVNAQ